MSPTFLVLKSEVLNEPAAAVPGRRLVAAVVCPLLSAPGHNRARARTLSRQTVATATATRSPPPHQAAATTRAPDCGSKRPIRHQGARALLRANIIAVCKLTKYQVERRENEREEEQFVSYNQFRHKN